MKNFDSLSELKCYSLERLMNIQKLLLKEIRFYFNNYNYNKNDIFLRLEELEIVVNVINEKILRHEKRKNKHN